MSGGSQAVFISYASQDVEAAGRICEALRAAGIEVWFDQSELRGGDAWDQSIRKQIKTCALFLPVISRNTHDRVEGYFRLEWKLAVDRSHLIAADQAFLLPVVVDDTRDDDERVPERFREVQWTHLPSGVTAAAFVERVRRLLSGELSQELTRTASAARHVSAAPSTRKPVLALWRSKAALLATIAVVVVALGYLVANRLVLSKRGAEVGAALAPAAQSAPATAFNPSPHSIAVLPFVDMSEKKDQEYFSDGMAEEIIDLLAKVPDLHVPARTSSFYFKGKSEDVPTIAKRLMVAHVLEGSVRKAGKTVRITAQLVRADTGYHLWSETYDRTLDDVFRVQDEIAMAVVRALKVSLLEGSLASADKPGGAEAHALYLQGRYYAMRDTRDDLAKGIAALEQAVRLAPMSAPYWAQLSRAYSNANDPSLDWNTFHERALQAAEKALALDPTLPEAHIARAKVAFLLDLDFPVAVTEVAKAQQLEPTNLDVIRWSVEIAHLLGHTDEAVRLAERTTALDPLSTNAYNELSQKYFDAGRYADAEAAARKALDLNPRTEGARSTIGLAMLLRGATQDAALAEIARDPDPQVRELTLAVANQIVGQPAEAAKWLAAHEPHGLRVDAYSIATLHALRGETDEAFAWLDKAFALRDSALNDIKADPLLKSLRTDPRYGTFLRKLKLPE